MAPYSRTEIKTVQLYLEAKSLSMMLETQVGDPHTSNPTNDPPTPLLTPAHTPTTQVMLDGPTGTTQGSLKKGVIRGLSPSSSEPQSL